MARDLADTALWPSGEPPAQAYCGERERLAILARYAPDTLHGDAELAEIAQFAAQLCQTEFAMVTAVEEEKQRFLAGAGVDPGEMPRSVSFCAHAMLSGGIFEVPDTREDERFRDNPLVTQAPHVRYYAGAPLISQEGAPIGALCVVSSEPRGESLTDFQRQGLAVLAQAVRRRLLVHRQRREVSAALDQQERRFQALADSIPDMIWSADAHGAIDYYNERWRAFTGLESEGEQGGPIHPDERAQVVAQWQDAVAAGKPFEDEFRYRQKDGTYRWVLGRALPVAGPDGGIERWFGTLTDIDVSHRLSESREMLARELVHRIKNIFAVITGLIALRSRDATDVKTLVADLTDTIRALGRAQDFVRPLSAERGDDLLGLLGVLMAPYGNGQRAQVTVSGQTVPIGIRAATPIALVFHELATNSAKYGALSVAEGTVAIAVSDAGETIAIEWREAGGPPVERPEGSGFGSRLLEMSVRSQLDGTLEHEWAREGLRVKLHLPKAMLVN